MSLSKCYKEMNRRRPVFRKRTLSSGALTCYYNNQDCSAKMYMSDLILKKNHFQYIKKLATFMRDYIKKDIQLHACVYACQFNKQTHSR